MKFARVGDAGPSEGRQIVFSCRFCGAEIIEPIGRFCQPYQCYVCGTEIRIADLVDLDGLRRSTVATGSWLSKARSQMGAR